MDHHIIILLPLSEVNVVHYYRKGRPTKDRNIFYIIYIVFFYNFALLVKLTFITFDKSTLQSSQNTVVLGLLSRYAHAAGSSLSIAHWLSTIPACRNPSDNPIMQFQF